MIISKKKYKKINDDLVDAKAKVDDAKKALDDENKIMRVSLLIKKQRDQYKAERDTLIDDIAVLKANISRLERENEQLNEIFDYQENKKKEYRKTIEKLNRENRDLKHENKALRLQSNTYFDEWQTVKNLYTTLTNHIRMKAEHNPGVSRYLYLVNYIDRLERD